jgi:hypothetical protein
MHPRTEVIQSGVVRNLNVTESLSFQGSSVIPGGLAGFTGSQNSTGVNTTVNASRVLVDATSVNADIVLQPKGTGAILAQLPDGTVQNGDKRGAQSVDFQMARWNATHVASGANSAIITGNGNSCAGARGAIVSGEGNAVGTGVQGFIGNGFANTIGNNGSNAAIVCGQNSTVNGARAIVGAGNQNQANGANSFVGAGTNNTAQADNSAIVSGSTISINAGSNNFIGGGNSNTLSSGSNSAISGGQQNTIAASNATIGGGVNNVVSGIAGFVGGGWGNVATAPYSSVPGGWYNDALADYSSAIGMIARANAWNGFAHGGSRFASPGEVQYERVIFSRQTTTGAASEMFLDGAEAVYNGVAPTRRFVLDTNCAYAFSILAVGRRRDVVGEAAAYKIEGAIRSDGGTVSFIGTPTKTVLGEDVAAWDVAVSANNTNKTLEITATGEASKTIRWSAVVELIKIV